MDNAITIEEQEREYEAQLTQERLQEELNAQGEQNQSSQTKPKDSDSSPNWPLGIVMLMFAAPADLLGLIPVVGPVISGTMFGILKLMGKLSNYSRPSFIAGKIPSNTALVITMFFVKPKTLQSSSNKLGKLKKII